MSIVSDLIKELKRGMRGWGWKSKVYPNVVFFHEKKNLWFEDKQEEGGQRYSKISLYERSGIKNGAKKVIAHWSDFTSEGDESLKELSLALDMYKQKIMDEFMQRAESMLEAGYHPGKSIVDVNKKQNKHQKKVEKEIREKRRKEKSERQLDGHWDHLYSRWSSSGAGSDR